MAIVVRNDPDPFLLGSVARDTGLGEYAIRQGQQNFENAFKLAAFDQQRYRDYNAQQQALLDNERQRQNAALQYQSEQQRTAVMAADRKSQAENRDATLKLGRERLEIDRDALRQKAADDAELRRQQNEKIVEEQRRIKSEEGEKVRKAGIDQLDGYFESVNPELLTKENRQKFNDRKNQWESIKGTSADREGHIDTIKKFNDDVIAENWPARQQPIPTPREEYDRNTFQVDTPNGPVTMQRNPKTGMFEPVDTAPPKTEKISAPALKGPAGFLKDIEEKHDLHETQSEARRQMEQDAWDKRNKDAVAAGKPPLDPTTRPADYVYRPFNQATAWEEAIKRAQEEKAAHDNIYGAKRPAPPPAIGDLMPPVVAPPPPSRYQRDSDQDASPPPHEVQPWDPAAEDDAGGFAPGSGERSNPPAGRDRLREYGLPEPRKPGGYRSAKRPDRIITAEEIVAEAMAQSIKLGRKVSPGEVLEALGAE